MFTFHRHQPSIIALSIFVGAIIGRPEPAMGQNGSNSFSDLEEHLNKISVLAATEHYRIYGTVTKKRAEDYGRCLEFIHREFARGFSSMMQGVNTPRTPRRKSTESPPPSSPKKAAPGANSADKEKHRLVVMATKADYDRFAGDFLGYALNTEGYFVPGPRLILVTDRPSDSAWSQVYFFAFLQFLERYVHDAPRWVTNGIASYYTSARQTPHGLVFDRPRKDYWDASRVLIQAGAALSVRDIIYADRRDFYDKTALAVPGLEGHTKEQRMFAQSYTLAAMLLSTKEGREQLQKYLRDLAHSDGPEKYQSITAKYFDDKTCEKLHERWVQFVQSQPDIRSKNTTRSR